MTISLTIQEFAVIQACTFGKIVSALWPRRSNTSSGDRHDEQREQDERDRVEQRVAVTRQVQADDDHGDQSVGIRRKSRKPSLNANRGVAVASFPIHFGGSASFRRRYTRTASSSSNAMIT